MKGISVSILLIGGIVLIAGFILSSNLTGEFHLLKRTGKLYVTSTPSGANVYVDDVFKGTTPITVNKLSVGTHAVKLTKSGYNDYLTSVNIKQGKTTELNVALTPITLPPPTPPTVPDLTVDIANLIVNGNNVAFNATVKNIGIADANGYTYNVDFGDGASTGPVQRLTKLLPVQNETLPFSHQYSSSGTYTLKVNVSTTGDINLANNEIIKTVSIGTGGGGGIIQPITKPDLVVSSITFTTHSSAPKGTLVNITATISNTGNATASNFYVDFTHLIHSHTMIGEKVVSSLVNGSRINVTQQWTTANEANGTHTIAVTADSRFNVTEWNENNNNKTTTYALN